SATPVFGGDVTGADGVAWVGVGSSPPQATNVTAASAAIAGQIAILPVIDWILVIVNGFNR
ncbi:hypothetical protein V4C53_47165, partial [Paraburkholderia azotifigens]|uniref:hypothetical protein n=2 Tax=Paraburkholderia TaxID=1822464 RepID=UPI003177E5DA